MNIAGIVGRLTAEPTVRQTTSGKMVVSFTVAVSEGKDTTYFIDCVAWDKSAEFVSSWFHKGQWIAVDGALTTRTYEDNNHAKRKVTEIRVAHASFCSNKSENAGTDIQVEESATSGNLPF